MAVTFNRLSQFFIEIQTILGCRYDARRDCNRLPVVSAAAISVPKPEIKVDNNQYVVKNGTMYVKRMVVNDYGNLVPEWDSENPILRTNRNENLTEYDNQVFAKYKTQYPEHNDYKYLTIEKYAVIKKHGWSKAKNENEMIGYRKAAEIEEIKKLKGCGERRCQTYYKLMNEAFVNELNDSAPIERG